MPAIAYMPNPVPVTRRPVVPAAPQHRLQSGDHLKQPEFHRRYKNMPEHVRAELVEGIVYMASPLRHKSHGRPHAMVITWLGNYSASTPGTDCGDNCTLFMDLDNEVQPDAFLRLHEGVGGRSRTTPEDYLAGAPEFIFEVAASSASYDLHQKKEAYRRNGVQEYAVWRTEDAAVDWWALAEGEYVRIEPDAQGHVWSLVFPGLVLDVPALLSGRLADVLSVLNAGMQKPEHAAFVAEIGAQE
jgi:Uma2 family endonuclease